MGDIEVPCDDPNFNKLSMRILVSNPDEVSVPKHVKTPGGKAQRTKQRMDFAQQYLTQHRLEELIADAMREVLHQKPDNPHAFLSSFILRHTLPRLDGAVNAIAPVDLRPSCPGAMADPSGAGPRLAPLVRAPSPPPAASAQASRTPAQAQPSAPALQVAEVETPAPKVVGPKSPEDLSALSASLAIRPRPSSKDAKTAQKANFQRRFEQLGAQGLSPNEAAAEAIRQLRRGASTPPGLRRDRAAPPGAGDASVGARQMPTSPVPTPPTPSCREAAQREMHARANNSRAP